MPPTYAFGKRVGIPNRPAYFAYRKLHRFSRIRRKGSGLAAKRRIHTLRRHGRRGILPLFQTGVLQAGARKLHQHAAAGVRQHNAHRRHKRNRAVPVLFPLEFLHAKANGVLYEPNRENIARVVWRIYKRKRSRFGRQHNGLLPLCHGNFRYQAQEGISARRFHRAAMADCLSRHHNEQPLFSDNRVSVPRGRAQCGGSRKVG